MGEKQKLFFAHYFFGDRKKDAEYGNRTQASLLARDTRRRTKVRREVRFAYYALFLHPRLYLSISPYFTFTRSSLSTMGSAINHRKKAVAAEWIISIGSPDRYVAAIMDLVILV